MNDITHIDESLARGLARQYIRQSTQHFYSSCDRIKRRSLRAHSLSSKPARRYKQWVDMHQKMFKELIIGVTKNPGKRSMYATFFLAFCRNDAKRTDDGLALDVVTQSVTSEGPLPDMYDQRITISQHAVERIIQRTHAESLRAILKELCVPLIHISTSKSFRTNKAGVWLPTPGGMALVVEDLSGDDFQNYRTVVTYVPHCLMTPEQIETWKQNIEIYPDVFQAEFDGIDPAVEAA